VLASPPARVLERAHDVAGAWLDTHQSCRLERVLEMTSIVARCGCPAVLVCWKLMRDSCLLAVTWLATGVGERGRLAGVGGLGRAPPADEVGPAGGTPVAWACSVL
jgi:hypothetical protein